MSEPQQPAAETVLEPKGRPPTPFAPGDVAGIVAPMVGRDGELQQLVAALYTVVEGGPSQLLTVVGPAGIGKSRLAHEFRQVLTRLPEPVALLTLQPDSASSSQPYSLYRQLVVALFALHEGDPPAILARQLEQGVVALLGPGNEERAYLIALLAGYELPGAVAARFAAADPRLLRNRALQATAQCLAAVALQAPLVLLFDDLHHADDGSLEALALLVEHPSPHTLILCLAQQRLYERRPGWGNTPNAARIDLAPLDERDSRRLVAEILRKAGKLPVELRNLIVSRADGNPYYVEELLKAMVADSVIVPGPAAWIVQPGRLSRLRVPATLGELLRARVFALAPREREFLLRAAAVGRRFWVEAALALGGEPETHDGPVEAMLAGLEAADLIALSTGSRFPGQHEYLFRHELLHEVAYGLIPADQRAGYHQRAAAWLMARAGERADSLAALIAEHFERAGQPQAAGRWQLRAAEQARASYAPDAALSGYQAALALLRSAGGSYHELVAAHEGLARTQIELARLADAVDNFHHMAHLAAAAGDASTEARALNLQALCLDTLLDYPAAAACATRAIALAEASGDQRQLGRGLYHLAYAEMRFEHAEPARELAERSLALLKQTGDGEGAALCTALLGLLSEQRNDFPGAMRYLDDSLAYNRQIGNMGEVVMQLNNLGYMSNVQGDYAAALGYLSEALEVAAQVSTRTGEIYVLSNLGFALNGLGRYADAEAETRRGIELSERNRVPVFADFFCALAEALLGQGRATEALEAADQALDAAREHEGPREVAYAWRALGRAIGISDDPQGATACFAESVRLLGEIGAEGERGRTLRYWAEHELARGDRKRGHELWAQARHSFAEAGLTRELARTPGH